MTNLSATLEIYCARTHDQLEKKRDERTITKKCRNWRTIEYSNLFGPFDRFLLLVLILIHFSIIHADNNTLINSVPHIYCVPFALAAECVSYFSVSSQYFIQIEICRPIKRRWIGKMRRGEMSPQKVVLASVFVRFVFLHFSEPNGI